MNLSRYDQTQYDNSKGVFMQATCLCGAIQITAPNHQHVSVCHCSICRRWSGGPLFALHCSGEVAFSGDSPARYQSSAWAQRGFCRTCGTHLFYHLLPSGQYILPAGLFQDQPFELTTQIFIDEKPSYYALKNATHQLTGAEVFAMFQANQ